MSLGAWTMVALVTTCTAWAATALRLALGLARHKRSRPGSRWSIMGGLVAITGWIPVLLGVHYHWPDNLQLTLATVAEVLAVAGLACVIAAAAIRRRSPQAMQPLGRRRSRTTPGD